MSNSTIELINLSGTATTREEAISEAADMLIAAGAVTDEYKSAMFERESSVSTYMGNFLAIPHGTLEAKDAVLQSALAIIRYEKPILWNDEEVRFVIGIAGKNNTHMDSLAIIAEVFSDMTSVESMIDAKTTEQVLNIFSRARAA